MVQDTVVLKIKQKPIRCFSRCHSFSLLFLARCLATQYKFEIKKSSRKSAPWEKEVFLIFLFPILWQPIRLDSFGLFDNLFIQNAD